jgi:hypothetical protein
MNNILYMNVDVDYNATKCIINNSNINLTPLSNIEHYGLVKRKKTWIWNHLEVANEVP